MRRVDDRFLCYRATVPVSRWRSRACFALLSLIFVVGCRTTVDSLGHDDVAGAVPRVLHPLTGPSSYPNAFRDVLNQSDNAISSKIDQTFNQLFHGDPNSQAIFFQVGGNEANIQDSHHSNEIRTEGMGYAMIIAVELDKQTEFDQLWRYSKSELMETSGPDQGYFKSYCDTSPFDSSNNPTRCLDPFGLEQFVMALIFAHDRWTPDGSTADAGSINYESDVWMLLDTMRYKERDNGGIVGNVTNTFDDTTHLVFNTPDTASSNFTRPSAEMPAYYELWAQATGDPYWSAAASSARNYWHSVANSDTGLMPVRAYFSGQPCSGWDMYAPEGYRTQLNMVLDQIWNGKDAWDVTEADALIKFFVNASTGGPNTYGRAYTLDGTVIDQTQNDFAIEAANGMTALISTNSNRNQFINTVWTNPIPQGQGGYYAGLLDLLALMVLGGHYRVY